MPLTRNVISGWFAFGYLKMRWASVPNDHLGPKPLISDSATWRSLWPVQYQPAALDDNEWQISKTLVQSSIQTHGQVSKKSYFEIWHFWKSYCWLNKAHKRTWASEPEPEAHVMTRLSEPEPEPPEPVHFARSRSRSRRTVLLGAGAGAGAVMLPRSRSRSRPKMSRLRIPAYYHNKTRQAVLKTINQKIVKHVFLGFLNARLTNVPAEQHWPGGGGGRLTSPSYFQNQ